MAFWSKWFGSSYDDEKLVSSIHTAVMEDPMIMDPGKLTIESKGGAITLSGKVQKQMEKDHVEGTVRNALRYHGLKFESLVNNITVGITEKTV